MTENTNSTTNQNQSTLFAELGKNNESDFHSFIEEKPEIKINSVENVCETPLNNYLSTIKSRIGDIDVFIQFEHFLHTQNAELLFVKKNCEHLRTALNKSQEDRRSLELQLVAEKALRDQETRNAETSIENNTIQSNAKLYAMKFEVETWKHKTDAISKESHLLKEQLKLVEAEKSEATRQLSEITERNSGYENFRKSFELYSMRIGETIRDLTRQLSQLEAAREELGNLLKSFQEEVNVLNVHVKTQAEQVSFMEQRTIDLENELFKRKTE